MGAVERRSATWSAVEVRYCREMRQISFECRERKECGGGKKIAQFADWAVAQ
jgi:hypothetical protein